MVQENNILAKFFKNINSINNTYVSRYNNDENDYSTCATSYSLKMPSLLSYMIYHRGAANIYYIDDDKFYDNVSGQTFYNTNSGDDETPIMPLDLYDGFINGMLDESLLLQMRKNELIQQIYNTPLLYNNINDFINCHFNVIVEGGRKWRGEGYLVSIFDVPNYNGYGSTKMAKVYDPSTNKIETVTAKFIKYSKDIDINGCFTEYKKDIIDNINSKTVSDINVEKNSNNITINYDITPFVDWMTLKYGHTIDLDNAYDVVEEEKKARFEAFKTKKMPSIIEWVKTNTDKTNEEDINKLAEHIFNKHYSK